MDADADARARAAIALSEANRPAIVATVEHNYRWVRGNDPDQIHLFDGPLGNGTQLGTWVYSEGAYHPYHEATDSWGYPKPLPKGAPSAPAQAVVRSVPMVFQC